MAKRARKSRNKAHSRDPRYPELAKLIRGRIERGHYPVGSQLPPETALANELKANSLTISRALKELVREGLVVRRRGSGTFVTDRRKPPILEGRHLRVGLLWRNSVLPKRLHDSFYGDITRGVLSAWGLETVQPVWSAPHQATVTRGSWNAPAQGITVECVGEALHLAGYCPDIQEVLKGRYDALMTLGVIEQDYVEQLLESGIPTVLVDFPSENLVGKTDMVYADALPGYRAAVAQLARLGHKQIHFISGLVGVSAPPGLEGRTRAEYLKSHRRLDPDNALRLQAYRVGMDECNLPVQDGWIHRAGVSGNDCLELANWLSSFPAPERPDAVVCFSLAQAETVMRIFADKGIKLDAAGSTGNYYGGAAHAIQVSGNELGAAAAALLTSRLREPHRPVLRVGVPMLYQPDGMSNSVNLGDVQSA